jgi:hypothetical protein
MNFRILHFNPSFQLECRLKSSTLQWTVYGSREPGARTFQRQHSHTLQYAMKIAATRRGWSVKFISCAVRQNLLFVLQLRSASLNIRFFVRGGDT